MQLIIIDLAQKGGAQAPFALPLPTGLNMVKESNLYVDDQYYIKEVQVIKLDIKL